MRAFTGVPKSLPNPWEEPLYSLIDINDVENPPFEDQLQEHPNDLLNPFNYVTPGAVAAPVKAVGRAAIEAAPRVVEAAPRVVEGLGALLADEAGSFRPGRFFLNESEGVDPTQITPKEWGKHVDNISKEVREKANTLLGARILDKFPNIKDDPFRAAIMTMFEDGVPLRDIRRVELNHMGNGSAFGLVGPPRNHRKSLVRLDLSGPKMSEEYTFQNPVLHSLGTGVHEGLHAVNILQDIANQAPTPTMSIPESLFNKNDPLSKGFRALATPGYGNGTGRGLPRSFLDLLYTPKRSAAVNNYLTQLDSGNVPADILLMNPRNWARQFRYSLGNRGVRGTDPFLADLMQSGGHWGGEYANMGNLGLSPYQLARDMIREGGEVNPEWLKLYPRLGVYQKLYKSRIRPPGMPPYPGTRKSIFGPLFKGKK